MHRRKIMISAFITLIAIFIFTTSALSASKLTDVGDYWATEAINWAVSEEIVSGYPDGTFKPKQNLTEEQFAAMLARYASNVDKEALIVRYEGKSWSHSTYDELSKFQLPLLGYNNDKASLMK